MKLNLKRPLAFFDLEATGTNVATDRIVEISIIKLHPDDREEVKSWRVNPGVPIPLESSLIHGIYDGHVAESPRFNQLAAQVAEFLKDSDLAGFNSNKFDIPMLVEEFLRAGVSFDLDKCHFVDVQNIFHQMEQRTLKAAYQFYCGKPIVNAHSAEADTRATMEVLIAQVERYENRAWEDKKGNMTVPIVNDIEALHKFTNLNRPVDFAGRMAFNEDGEEVFNFGKHKGKKVEDILTMEPSYYSWMMQGDFPLYTKRKLEEIFNRWNAKRHAERQAKAAALAKPAETFVKIEVIQPAGPTVNMQTAPQTGMLAKKDLAHTDETPVKKDIVRPAETPVKKDFQRTEHQKPNHQYNQNRDNKSFKKKDEGPALPVNEDMLKQLAEKFKKGL